MFWKPHSDMFPFINFFVPYYFVFPFKSPPLCIVWTLFEKHDNILLSKWLPLGLSKIFLSVQMSSYSYHIVANHVFKKGFVIKSPTMWPLQKSKWALKWGRGLKRVQAHNTRGGHLRQNIFFIISSSVSLIYRPAT